MGTALTGLEIRDTYDALIKIGDNGPIGASAKYVGDGLGNDSKLSLSTGNIGINTTSPSTDFHVEGSVRITGAIYDSNNQAGTNGQVLTSTGTALDWKSLSEITGVDGTGTANYISKWSDTDTITNSQLFDNGTNVGVGTAVPAYKLDVSGTFNTTGAATLGSTLGVTGAATLSSTLAVTGNVTVDTDTFFVDTTNNRVGVGTITPSVELEVDGSIKTAAAETSTAAAWKLGNVGLGGVFVATADYLTVEVGGFVVKLPIAIFPDSQNYYDRVIADGGDFEGVLAYESAVTILKSN